MDTSIKFSGKKNILRDQRKTIHEKSHQNSIEHFHTRITAFSLPFHAQSLRGKHRFDNSGFIMLWELFAHLGRNEKTLTKDKCFRPKKKKSKKNNVQSSSLLSDSYFKSIWELAIWRRRCFPVFIVWSVHRHHCIVYKSVCELDPLSHLLQLAVNTPLHTTEPYYSFRDMWELANSRATLFGIQFSRGGVGGGGGWWVVQGWMGKQYMLLQRSYMFPWPCGGVGILAAC